MNEKDVISALAKLAIKHEVQVNAVALGYFNIASIILAQLKRCESAGCTQPACVKHSQLSIEFCDRHCAAAIVAAQKNDLKENNESVTSIDVTIKTEENWVDVECAASIRYLSEYVEKVTSETQVVALH